MIFKIKLKEVIFYFAFALQCYHTMMMITINSYRNSSILVGAIVISLGLIILSNSYTYTQKQIVIFLIICAFIQLIVTSDFKFLRLVLMVLAAKEIKEEKLKRFLFLLYLIAFLGVVGASLYAGFNTIYQTGQWRSGLGFQIRYNLGFDGPIRLMMVWICLLNAWHIFYAKKSILLDLILSGISIYLFILTDCYSGLIGVIASISLPYIFSGLTKIGEKRLWKYIVKGSLLIVLLLTILSSVIDLSSAGLEKFLHGRAGGLYQFYSAGIYPYLFGKNIPYGAKGLDNSYFYILYELGIIPTAIMIVALIKLADVLVKKKDLFGCSCFVTFVLMAYVNQTLEVPFLNYFLFLIMVNWKEVITFGSERKIRTI